jgi:sialic acid synthase SpsE
MLLRVSSSAVPRVVLGAGGADLDEIEVALRILGRKRVVLMLGFQAYPTAEADNQLARIRALAERFRGTTRLEIGFADHADTTFPATVLPAAVAIGAGASMVEKHLTLGRVVRLEDHESALGPDEFSAFCSAVRSCDALLGRFGSGNAMGMSDAERAYRLNIRRHVVASRDLPAGHVVSAEDVMLRRTGCDAAIRDIRDAYGRTLGVAVGRHGPITPESFGGAQ